MKKNKLYLIISALFATVVGLIAIIIYPEEASSKIKTIKDSFKLIKNPNGTQQLPETKDADKTMNDLENDILKHNK